VLELESHAPGGKPGASTAVSSVYACNLETLRLIL
jgi:hypothetical protein